MYQLVSKGARSSRGGAYVWGGAFGFEAGALGGGAFVGIGFADVGGALVGSGGTGGDGL